MDIEFVRSANLRSFRDFFRRECSPLFAWYGIGALGAAVEHLVATDNKFHGALIMAYAPVRLHFSGFHAYSSFLIFAAAAFVLALFPRLPRILTRACRSWWFGVVSGLRMAAFVCAFITFALHPEATFELVLIDAAFIATCLAISYVIYLKTVERQSMTPRETEIQVGNSDLSIVGSKPSERDDPIAQWSEDILERARS